MRFTKYHALGNDYIVIEPGEFAGEPTPEQVRLICHRNFGIGSDGILLGPLPSRTAQFKVRIFNPDGSEAEKSGNGLRVFARYLWDKNMAGSDEVAIETVGGVVRSVVLENGRAVRVQMGTVRFWSDIIPVTGPRREVLNEKIEVGGREFAYCAATIGNPHCVLPLAEVDAALAKQFGPLLETHPSFPNRTNVQFMKVLDRNNVRIEIWERGAGYTLASGSSSCAAAAVAYRLGLCDSAVTVHMPGGKLKIEIGPEFAICMTGPVTRVCAGVIADEMWKSVPPA